MEKIARYEHIASLIAENFKKGVATNCFLTESELRREIAEERLFAHAWDGGLILLRRRDGHYRMNFYLNDMSAVPDVEFPRNTVTEIARREKDTGLLRAAEYFERLGFEEKFQRLRLVRNGEALEWDGTADFALEEDADGIKAVLAEGFDSVTGCIPTDTELMEDIAAKCFIVMKDEEGKVVGVLQIARKKAHSEIRHLAVGAAVRRGGVAGKMFARFMHDVGGGKTYVWVRKGNTPAEKFYGKNGFIPGGLNSVVLLK